MGGDRIREMRLKRGEGGAERKETRVVVHELNVSTILAQVDGAKPSP